MGTDLSAVSENGILNLLFENYNAVMLRLDTSGALPDCCGRNLADLPNLPEQIRGKRIQQFPPETWTEVTIACLGKVNSGQNSGKSEFITQKDGENCYYATWFSRIPNRDEWILIFQDVTDNKRMEQELSRNEERNRIISSMTTDYTYYSKVDEEGHLILEWVGGAFESITGYTLEEYQQSGGWLEKLFPEDRGKDQEDIHILRQNCPVVSDVRTIARDGSIVWVRSYAQPVWDAPQHRLSGIYGAVQDITRIKQAEIALRESEARYRMLFEQNPAPMLVYERDTFILLAVNDAFLNHYGYTREEITGFNLPDLYPAEEKLKIREVAKMLHGYQNTGEWHHIKKDGTTITIMACSHDVLYEGHTARLAVITDVTERKNAEDQVKKLNLELEQRVQERTVQLKTMNEELESFSYSISHDLRTPLRGLNGYAHFLREDYGALLPPEGLVYLDQINTGIRMMDSLITGLLKMSRLSRQACERREVLPRQIAEEAWNTLPNQVADRQIELTIMEMPACLSDPVLLQQVYVNLFSNAIKFTRHKPEAIIQAGFTQEPGRVVYWVQDNGVGFDMRYAQNLFEPFLRLPDQEQIEGYGIGLSIVKRIILKHGGEIWTESEPGHGAKFLFTVPNP